MGKEQTKHYQYYPFMNLGHFRLYDLVDRKTRKLLADYYRSGLERCARAAEKDPYCIGVPFIWCSNNLVVAVATPALLYERKNRATCYHVIAVKESDSPVILQPLRFPLFTR